MSAIKITARKPTPAPPASATSKAAWIAETFPSGDGVSYMTTHRLEADGEVLAYVWQMFYKDGTPLDDTAVWLVHIIGTEVHAWDDDAPMVTHERNDLMGEAHSLEQACDQVERVLRHHAQRILKTLNII